MTDNRQLFRTIVDIMVKLGFLFLMLMWCFQITQPFIRPIIWGVLIAIVVHPAFVKIQSRLGGRKKMSAAIITVGLLFLVLVPLYGFLGSLLESVQDIGQQLESKDFNVPPPPERVKEWAFVGENVYRRWDLASTNLEAFLERHEDMISELGRDMLSSVIGTGIGFLKFLLSIVISGVLLVNSEGGSKFARNFFRKLVGDRSDEFASLSSVTIRNVAKGILGVAAIQAALFGIGFLFAGVPYAGLWTLMVLILAIMQLPPAFVVFPIVVYLYSYDTVLAATIWTVYFVLVGLSDNILKPILLSQGAPVPMLIVFLGAIGGFILVGFAGLFSGAIILSLGYKLFVKWLETEANEQSLEEIKQ